MSEEYQMWRTVSDGVVKDKEVLLVLEPFDLLEKKAEATARLSRERAEHQRLLAGFRDEEKAQALARVEQLAARLRKLKNGSRPEEINAAASEVDQSTAQYERAFLAHQRLESLFAKKSISQAEMDQATSELKVARATVEARNQRLTLIKKGTRSEEIDEAQSQLNEAKEAWKLLNNGYRDEEKSKAKASVDASQAVLNAIERAIEELHVRSPTTAVVQAVDLQPGDLVGANVPVISLLDRSHLWVRAYVPENRLSIADGQKVWMTVDSLPGETFRGHISFVSEQAEFTPRNIQTPEERSKQVFRIKVTLDEGLDRLRPGMAADVWFEQP